MTKVPSASLLICLDGRFIRQRNKLWGGEKRFEEKEMSGKSNLRLHEKEFLRILHALGFVKQHWF